MGEGRWRTGAVVALSTGLFTAGCVSGCVFGVVVTGSGESADKGGGSDIPRISPIPLTPTPTTEPRAAFANDIASLPITFDDARLLAIATCTAFKQNPGTSSANAAEQLALRQGWSIAQGRLFLGAATESYCPEFRHGS